MAFHLDTCFAEEAMYQRFLDKLKEETRKHGPAEDADEVCGENDLVLTPYLDMLPEETEKEEPSPLNFTSSGPRDLWSHYYHRPSDELGDD